jgi:hypothetical protein
MEALYDRSHVELVLTRAGVPDELRNVLLNELRFPIRLEALQAVLAAHGITHDGLISRLGGSP